MYTIDVYYIYIVNNFTLVLGVPDYSSGTLNAGVPNHDMAAQQQSDSFYLRGALEPKWLLASRQVTAC